jgi:hypothetical protein
MAWLYWDIFLGERLRVLAGTLGGAALLTAGVTTIGGCGEFLDSMTLAGDVGMILCCYLVW